MKRAVALFVFASILLLVPASHVRAAPDAVTFAVNSADDDSDRNPGNGVCDGSLAPGDKCTLRAAIMETNALPGADTINLPAGTFTLTRNGTDNNANRGDLDITNTVTIVGIGSAPSLVRGQTNWDDRIFEIFSSGTDVRLTNLIVSDGDVGTASGGGIRVGPGAHLILDRVMIQNNGAGFGGGIANSGAVTMQDSSFIGNHAGNVGGAFFQGPNASLQMTRGEMRANVGIADTGGVENRGGTMVLDRVSITLNDGGGIDSCDHGASPGLLTMTNSTIARNTVAVPAESLNTFCGTSIIINSTIDESIFTLSATSFQNATLAQATGPFSAQNSIIAECNTPSSQLNSLGYNLIQNAANCTISGNLAGNLLNVDPKLAPLQNNGGLTSTRALLVGSPAKDAGNPSGCAGTNNQFLTQDQRGSPRPTDGNGDGTPRCDIGAFEVGAVGIGSVSPHKGSSAPREQVLFDLAWDSPTRWRDLDTVDLRFKQGGEILLWLRFTEGLPTSTFSLLDADGNVVDSGNAGEAKVLKNEFGNLDLAASGFTAAGPDDPHVVLHFAVTFSRNAQGKLKTQMLATDDFANDQGPEPGGKWRVIK